MLVIHGFFENGVFTPNKPIENLKGRQEATLTIREHDKTKEKQINLWTEILEELSYCDEKLTGKPERIHFKNPVEIDAL